MNKRDVLNRIYEIISAPNNSATPLDWHNEETRRYEECRQIAHDAGYADGTFHQLWKMAVDRYAVAISVPIK